MCPPGNMVNINVSLKLPLSRSLIGEADFKLNKTTIKTYKSR